jgi:SOS response regulatory protein OraA/RecX
VQRKRGGAMVKSIKPGSLAFNRGGLRKSMALLEINDEDVSHLELSEIIQKLKNAAWPLKTVWKSAPSRSISPHARWHSRKMAMEKVQNESIESMRREEVEQRMIEEEIYKREYDLVYMKFQNLKPLIDDGSLTLEEAVAMAHKKGNEEEESEVEKEENKVERYSEENIHAAIQLIQKKVLKGKPLPEDEESRNKIKEALLQRDYSAKEVDEVIERLTLLNPEEL